MIKQTCLTICILLMGWLMSCQEVDDRIGPPGVVDGNKLEVSITTSVPAISVQTRSTTSTEPERRLQHVDVLVFEAVSENGVEIEKFAYRTNPVNDLSALDYTANNVEIKVRLDMSRDNEQYRIVFIANLKNELDQLFENNDHVGELKDDLLEKITFSNDEQWPADTPLPMWGEASETTKIDDTISTGDFGTMNLVRSMARIQVGVSMNGGNGIEKFDIKSVKVWNAHQTGLAVPYRGNMLDNKPTAPSLAGHTDRIHKDKMKYEVSSEEPNQVNGIYVNEASNQTDGQEKTDALFLVIEAVYKGQGYESNTTPTFYKVGFYNSSNKPVDILRNYTYNMMITGVHGPGKDDEDKAANSDSNSLTVSMTDWSDGEMKHVVFNGQNFLAVSESTLEISRAADTHEILVQTNYSTGWKAEVIEGGSWITSLSPGTWTVPTGEPEPEKMKIPLSFDVTENTGESSDREGVIRLSCGGDHLSLDVKVVQSTEEEYSLTILINNPDYPDIPGAEEFIEFDRVITFHSGAHRTITPREVKVIWEPSRLPLKVDFTEYFAWGEDTNIDNEYTNGEATFVVAPAPLETRAPEDWYPEAMGDIQVQIGEEKTTKQNILIRRRHFEVYIEKSEKYILDGDTHTFKLYSNTNWEAEVPSGQVLPYTTPVSDLAEVITIIDDHGGYNLGDGDDIEFELKSVNANISADIVISITFLDLDVEVTKEYTFHVYSDDSTDPVRFGEEANCYVLQVGENAVSIPVSQANRSDLNTNKISSGDILTAELIWTDHRNGYNKDGDKDCPVISVIMDPDNSTGPGARLIVTSGNTPGNAVVAVKNSSGKICWSWHIWVVDDPIFDPYEGDNWNGFRYYEFLDRNLGALSAEAGTQESIGLYYQWGRKDPFPSAVGTTNPTLRPRYDKAGNEISWSSWKAYYNDMQTHTLMKTIEDPTLFISPSSNGTWYSVVWNAYEPKDFWNVMQGSSLSSSEKGIFDPCPEGWKTIPGDSQLESSWYDLPQIVKQESKNGYTYSTTQGILSGVSVNLGDWPHTGYISGSSGEITEFDTGNYWTGTFNSVNEAWRTKFWHNGNKADAHPSQTFAQMNALPVRCIRRLDKLKN